ncbi:MAG: hypothetical protein OEX12_00880, partial [Gammaproteobacteria bacterium]|nr:hypothetical protein [Gammaproteobacteria bacterium]
MDLQQTRVENNQRLTPHLKDIAQGQMIDALEPFAKAYLGLYYQLDNSVAPRQRVAALANDDVVGAIMQGMQTRLQEGDAPSAVQIGEDYLDGEGIGYGYVLLAAVEEHCGEDSRRVLLLNETTQAALLCYPFLHANYQTLAWHEHILQQRPQWVIEVLQQFWSPWLQQEKEFLPGLQSLIRGTRYAHITTPLALQLLALWPQCDVATMRRLMQWALHSEDRERLLQIADERIEALSVADIRRKVYWLTTAFIISPQNYVRALSQYIGRTKEKVLPLLDYVVALLKDPAVEQHLSAMDLAHLLRIIAPIFARNKGRGGLLDDNSTRVLWLFEQLGDYPQAGR